MENDDCVRNSFLNDSVIDFDGKPDVNNVIRGSDKPCSSDCSTHAMIGDGCRVLPRNVLQADTIVVSYGLRNCEFLQLAASFLLPPPRSQPTTSSPCLSNLCLSSQFCPSLFRLFLPILFRLFLLRFPTNSRISSPSLSNLHLSSHFLDLSSIKFSDAVSLFLFWLSLLSLPSSIFFSLCSSLSLFFFQ